jgi:MFS transporter, CP family, cyanate transporter
MHPPARVRCDDGGATGPAAPGVPVAHLSPWVLLPVLGMVGFVARDSYGAVPPLFGQIRHDLGLSAFALGLLTAVPTAFMGLFAPSAQRLAARMGAERTIAAALVVLTVAKATRLGGASSVVLYGSSAVIGACMGAVSTLVPALVGPELGRVRGVATGVVALSFAAATGLGAYVAVPLAHELGGWKESIAFWALPSAVASVVWVALMVRWRRGRTAPPEPMTMTAGEMPVAVLPAEHRLPWHSPTARWVTAFVCLQSIVAFSAVAWVIPALDAAGWSAGRSALMMLIFQAVQGVAMLVVPACAHRMTSKRPVLAVSGLCTLGGVLALAVQPTAFAALASVLLGLGLGGGFSLGYVLIMDYAPTRLDAARLAAMVFLVSYVVASFGPLAVGLLRDVTGGYRAGFLALAAVQAVQLALAVHLRPGRSVSDEAGGPRSAGPDRGNGRRSYRRSRRLRSRGRRGPRLPLP